MTPKRKAEDLITKFRKYVTIWDCYRDAPIKEKDIIADAKQAFTLSL